MEEKNTLEQSKTITEEEFKKYQSDTEKGVQKLHGQIKEKESEVGMYKQAFKELENIGNKPEYLVELSYTNPKLADIILNDYFDGISIDYYKEQNNIIDKDIPGYIENLTNKKANEIIEKKECDKIYNEFINKLGYSDDTIKQFEEEYKDIVDGRQLNSNNIIKYLEKAHVLVNKDKFNNLNAKNSVVAIGDGGNSSKGGKKDSLVSSIMQSRKTSG